MPQKREPGRRKRISRDSNSSPTSNRRNQRTNDDKPYARRGTKRGFEEKDDRRENSRYSKNTDDRPYAKREVKRGFEEKGERRGDSRYNKNADDRPYSKGRNESKSRNYRDDKEIREDRRYKKNDDRPFAKRGFEEKGERRGDSRYNKNSDDKPYAKRGTKRGFEEKDDRRGSSRYNKNADDRPYSKGRNESKSRNYRDDKDTREDRRYKKYDDESSQNQPRTRQSYGKPASKGGSIKTNFKPYIKKTSKDNYAKPASNLIRLNKFISNAGICSRREADEYIKAGVVTVNGKTITELGSHINPKDQVKFNNQSIKIENKIYLLLNKPKDFVTTFDDPHANKTVMDLVRNACRERIYPVGRLDKSTTGLLLFTNDGDLTKRLTHPKYRKKKIYHAYLNKNITKADMQKIADGFELEDGFIQADAISFADPVDKKQVGIEIHSGKNRIVRRIFEHLDYKVVKLDRVYFAGLTKKNLPRGKWRFLSQKEMNMLQMNAFE